MENSVDRIKCAMIIFELERSLGRLCKERRDILDDSPVSSEIKKRNDNSPTGGIVENSFLAEVISLALHVSKGTSSEQWLNNLNTLISALSIYEIRNAVSHPNRPFPAFYWYRCAAIASDPSIDALGLREVQLAFSNAQEGKIQEPPEDWLYKMRWSVPALLPNEFEHSITGLVGRAKDTARLERELENSRLPLIAIVARGGVGKTSLLLQVVSDFCLSPNSAKFFDAAIWETLKQERLTKDGVEQLSAPASLADIKDSISQSIGELFGQQEGDWGNILESTGGKRILLCLDNLEVILRDNAKEFQEFHESLPASWKVIVTSRIPVDGAKNLPLDVLDKSGGIAMVRAYLNSRGHHDSKDTAFMERIAVGCKFNPLAIRLSVDLFLAGKEIDFALQKTEQDVLSFSFTSLLDSLTTLDNNILEALFALSWSSRVEICNALKSTVDDVAESLSKLLSMSLLQRRESQSNEEYSLALSIRDLLRAYPRQLATRTRVANWSANSRATEEKAQKIQTERNISQVALNYIPPDTIAAYLSICHQSDAAVKRNDRVSMLQHLAACRIKIAHDPDSSFLHRVLGNILLGLDDPTEALASFQRAHELKKDDPAPLFGLLTAYSDLRRWHDMENAGDQLISNQWGEPEKSGQYFANRIWGSTLRASNLNENIDKVFSHTKDWESRLQELPAIAIGRAAAYRRLIEIEDRQNRLEPKRLLSLLAKAATILTKVALAKDFPKWTCLEIGRLISDIKRNESRNINSADAADQECVAKFLQFCANNSQRIMLEGVSSTLLSYCRSMAGSPVHTEPPTDDVSKKFKDAGYTFAEVKRTPDSKHRFFQVKDKSGRDYWVNLDTFENGKVSQRKKLLPGTKIAIKLSNNKFRGLTQASEAWLL